MALPSGERLSPTQVARGFHTVGGRFPGGLGPTTFTLPLPTAWTAYPVDPVAAAPAAGAPARVIAQFNGPEIDLFAPFAQIHVAVLAREIAAKYWLVHYLQQMGYVLRHLETVSDSVADALAGFEINGRVVAARITLRRFGTAAIIVMMGVAAEHYDAYADQFGLAVRGLSVAGWRVGGRIEPWQQVKVDSAITFQLPQSWQTEIIPGPDAQRGAINLTSRGDTGIWTGQFRVRWLARDYPGSDAEDARKMVAEFASAGIRLGKRLSSSDQFASNGTYAMTADMVTEAFFNGDDTKLEFWQIALRGPAFRVLIAMLTPARDTSALWWGINRRAVEIAITTLM